MLIRLHRLARHLSPGIQELGLGIRKVGADGAPLPGIDREPRLVIDNCGGNVSFEKHGHLEKLRNPPRNLQVKMVQKMKDLAL